MPTINQITRGSRKRKRRTSKTARTLEGRPFASGIVLKTFVIKPVKPNSGDKKCCRVRLKKSGVDVTAYIPGEGHNVQEHAVVLVRGGTVQDLSGVKHKVVRGWGPGDCQGCGISPKFKVRRNRKRSKYGTRKE